MTVPADEEDAATAALWEEGTAGIEVRPAEAGEVALLAYFADAPRVPLAVAAALAGLPGARCEPAEVPDVDWLARFREGFRSFRASGFRIVPAWEARGTTARSHDVLVVDPGRAFGTGSHETTRLVLAWLRERAARGPLGRVLDLGTGSGILALAAARLGAQPVVAVDVDPEAIASASRHARLNGVDVRIVQGDLARPLRPGAFDLVLANLSASLLRQRRDEITGLGAPALVLSGLLASDLAAVRAAYAGAGRIEVREDGEWVSLLVQVRAP